MQVRDSPKLMENDDHLVKIKLEKRNLIIEVTLASLETIDQRFHSRNDTDKSRNPLVPNFSMCFCSMTLTLSNGGATCQLFINTI